jgi:SAM-dependent methyltransferase
MPVDPCPACGSTRGRVHEELELPRLADVWSKLEPGSGEQLKSAMSRGEIPENIRIAQCPDCRLEYGSPFSSVGAEWYTQFERYGVRWEYFEVLKQLPPRAVTLLEVGCGEGHFMEIVSRAGHKPVGVDFNAGAVACAAKKGLDARCADLREFLLSSETFSAFALFHVIEHLDDPLATLRDLAQLAEPGATIFISCPGPNRFTTPMMPEQRAGRRDVWDYPPFHQTRWTKLALRKVLERSGWQLTRFAEEPLGWLALNAILRSNEDGYRRAGRLGKKARLGFGLPGTLLPAFRYKGMSILATAVRS